MLSLFKTIFLAGWLTAASRHDIRTREVPDIYPALLAALGLCDIRPERLPSMLLAAAIVFLLLYIPALFRPEKAMGGADIKLASAGAFLLGMPGGLLALVLGLLGAVLLVPLIRTCRKQPPGTPFPLVPFLSAGILTIRILQDIHFM